MVFSLVFCCFVWTCGGSELMTLHTWLSTPCLVGMQK